jgi:hypothetical protein
MCYNIEHDLYCIVTNSQYTSLILCFSFSLYFYFYHLCIRINLNYLNNSPYIYKAWSIISTLHISLVAPHLDNKVIQLIFNRINDGYVSVISAIRSGSIFYFYFLWTSGSIFCNTNTILMHAKGAPTSKNNFILLRSQIIYYHTFLGKLIFVWLNKIPYF